MPPLLLAIATSNRSEAVLRRIQLEGLIRSAFAAGRPTIATALRGRGYLLHHCWGLSAWRVFCTPPWTFGILDLHFALADLIDSARWWTPRLICRRSSPSFPCTC